MTGYEAPLADMRFVLHEMVDAAALTGLGGDSALDADDIDRVLDEATIMLLEGDLEGATLLAEAREALAENRIDEAEQLVRDAVNAYQ